MTAAAAPLSLFTEARREGGFEGDLELELDDFDDLRFWNDVLVGDGEEAPTAVASLVSVPTLKPSRLIEEPDSVALGVPEEVIRLLSSNSRIALMRPYGVGKLSLMAS
jgi:hypothetical protein